VEEKTQSKFKRVGRKESFEKVSGNELKK